MSFLNKIGWSSSPDTPTNELPDIFPFPILQRDFVSIDVENIYARILTDVFERTEGIPNEKLKLLFDNCVASEKPDGLITMLSKAMLDRKELFLVYDKGIDLIREADLKEAKDIREQYAKSNKSNVGVYISFKNYKKSDMVKLYSALDYLTIASLYKSMNISKAVQLKLADLRKSVGAFDKDAIMVQAKAIAKALSEGKDVAMDGGDNVISASPDLTATNSAMEFITQKLSFYLGMPASWITGLQNKGLGDTGEGDAKAVERGLKAYFFPIVKPVAEVLFGVQLTFKSEDFYGIQTATQTLQAFEGTTEQFISTENKLGIINKLFGLPAGSKGDEVVEPPPASTPPPPNPIEQA